MSQRPSGYARRPDEQYETVEWPILALLAARQIPPGGRVWDPCDRGCGQLVATLRAQGLDAIGTSADFFTITTAPAGVTDLITNPPYGENGRGELAVKFIEHALDLRIPRVAMLLASTSTAQSRGNICSDINASFAGKVVLLNRIKWFEGPSSPSDNHGWFVWNRAHVSAPTIQYITRAEAQSC